MASEGKNDGRDLFAGEPAAKIPRVDLNKC